MKGRRLAPLAALFTGACGLLGSDQGTVPVPSDGVGNFGSSAQIELCLGSARVVAPSASTGAGAVCVRAGSHGKACSADAACGGIERCVCGRCIIEACEGATPCSGGRVCRDKRCTTACSADGECDKGERCVLGGCARACASSAACHFGERCDDLDGVCVAQICSDAVPCGPGDACEAEETAGELREPDVVSLPEGQVAFVELRTGEGPSLASAIYRARVDGRRWTADPPSPVLAAVTGQRVGAPSPLVGGDGSIDLFFTSGEGASIDRARSTDGGRTFTRAAPPALLPGEGWENGWVGSPSVVSRNGVTLLFYEGGPRAGVGLAVVDATGAATRMSDSPQIAPKAVQDPLFWRDVTEVGAPYAIVAGDAFRVYFTARGAEGSDAIQGDTALPADLNDSIGLFTTRDLVRFDPYPNGPVFARVANLRAYLGERECAVRLPEGGPAEIVFVTSDASGAGISGLSRAPE
jgi:hypothetical protein